MKALLLIAAVLIQGCASTPNYQLDCEKDGPGETRLSKCKEYPWYMRGCERFR